MTTKFIGDGEKIITTVLLNGERIHIRVHTHANAQNVFDAIVQYIGLTEVVYFGLMIIKDGEQQFLDLDEKLSRLAKYAPHLWKDDNSCNSSLVFTVFFRVKYYVENICLLQEQQTRHQYYLQLRKDVLENSIRIHEDTSMVLASYALQAELGDYDRNVHGIDYFVPQHYLPARAIAKLAIPYIKNTLPAMHQSLRGLSESQAEIEFLKEAQKLSEYGILFHRVYKKEYSKQIPHNIGICLRGLVIYEETGPVRNSLCKYPWSKVKKMSFKRSKFIVEADTPNVKYSKLTFYTASYKRSSYLLKISSSFFNFQMKMGSKIAMLPEHVMQNTVPVVPLMRNESGVHLKSGLTSEPNSHSVVSARQSGSGKDSPKSKSQIKPEVKQYTLDLIKKDGSFGFSIVGGIELGGIFVKDITPGGPAALSRQINAGDRIVQINKVSFENVTRREAINTLRNAADKSKFIIESFGQNLVIEADASLNTPLVMSTQSITMTQPQIPLVQTERESEFIRVNLVKHNNTFGIGFTGGPELGGVYVKSLLPHSSAEIDGRIAVGDRLVEIDQVNVENFTRKKIQEFLKQVQGHVCIVVERYKQLPSAGGLMYIDREKVLRSSPNFTSITLSKKNDSLGFSITGGLDLGGIFVKYLNPNGPAACDKRLEIGDRVVGVNDISLETVSRQKALEILRNATSPVNLIIEKCMSPGGPLSKITDSGIKLLRSDSIKSLPTQAMHRQNIGTQSRNLNFSMQHLANAISGVPSSIINQLNTHDMNANYTASSKFNPPIKSSKEVFVVDLTKKNGCFGISLTGGVEVGGIFVKALKPGTHPSIQKGDRVIEINARRMDGLSGAEAVNWLKLSGNTATFILERYLYQPHESPQLSRLSSLDGDVLQLQLQRKNNSFGLCLVDGPEHCGIFVKSMLQGGSAELDGRVDRGDRLLEINGISLEGLNKHQAYDLLKQTTGILHLLVEKYHANENLRIFDKDMYSVELRKGDAGLGLSITGGPELGGIFVKGLLPGGAADASKKIQKGDRLVEVNSISLNGLSKQQAWEVFQKAPINMNLLMEKNAAFDNIIIPESDYFTVELHKKNNGYGLNLTGGPEIDGVYVKQVQKDSAADQDGRIRKGDRLITINGRNVESSTRQKCTEMLKLTQDIAVLLLERCVVGEDLPPLDTVLTVVKLTKSISGFGISLTGGPEIGGIFVKALMPGGCAEKDAHIQIGDRLVEINGQSFDNLSRQQATDLLKNSASTATFILERYKTRIKEQPIVYPSMTPDSTVSKPLLRPMERQSPQISEQHFAFPLYNGAAPSVPPRHNANGGPGRESAFKRFEQQQRVSSDSTQHNSYQLNNHGNTVSNRLPSYMQRQNSMERKENVDNYVSQDDQGESNQVYGSQNTHFTIPEIADQVAPFSVVEGPLRMYVTPHNDIVDDSPQRFIQKLSKSVVPQNADNALIASRVPLGPISSAIFGGNRDGRNVHELLDPEITREHIDGARFVIDSNGDSLSAEGYIRNSVEQRENNNAYEHPRNRITSNISCNQVAANVLVNTNSNTSVSKNISYKSIKPSVDVILQATKIENKGFQPANISDEYKNQQAYLPSPKPQSSPFNQDAKTTDKIYTKPLDKQETMANKNVNSSIKPAGLQWISFNSSGSNDQSVKNSVSSALRGADVNTSPSSPINKRNLPKNEPATSRSPQPLSCDIPVPFASRFNNTTKNKLPGDFVFEVTLYKGRNGFGMNLVGGGSADNPLKIKKIASGTSADESGQIRVGDILLEVNGKKLDHLVAKDVISMLRGCQSEVQLLVKRCASQDQISSLSSSSVGL